MVRSDSCRRASGFFLHIRIFEELQMSIKHLSVFALTLCAASISIAAEYNDFSNVVSTRSRAEVIAERDTARAGGDVIAQEYAYPAVPVTAASSLSRMEVLAAQQRFHKTFPHGYTDANYPEVFSTTMAQPDTMAMAGGPKSR
jgi:hypothetical protein